MAGRSNQCFNYFSNLDIQHFIIEGCFTFAISKLIGYGIVYCSFTLKIPQIIKLLSTKSAVGISIIGLTIESLGFLATGAYFYRKGYPTSTYGEAPIIFFENMIVNNIQLHNQLI